MLCNVWSAVEKSETRNFSKAPKGAESRNLRMRIVNKRPTAPRIPKILIKKFEGKILNELTRLILTPDAIACLKRRAPASGVFPECNEQFLHFI
jgi:hypothetical protein